MYILAYLYPDIRQDPEYIIITRSVPDYEMNFLKRHTEELRKKCIDQTPISQGPSSTSLPGMSPESAAQHPPSQGPDSNIPLPPTVNLDTVAPSDHLEHKSARSGNSDTMTKSKGAGASGLLLQTNRMQFEKWQAPTEENKRGECVLDVAMQPKEVSETTPTVNRFDSKRPLDFGSSDAQENFDVPVRLAINSRHVQVQLNKITGFDMDETDNVLHPPWKLIATYHEDIKRHFQELEKKATKEQGENLSKEDEHPEQAPAVGENEPIKVDAKIKVREQAGDGSILQLCEVCGSFCHEKKLECLRNTVSHLKCFVDFIDNDLKHVFELRHGLANGTTREIAFEDLWHLFSPGDLLVTSGPHRARQAYKVFHTSGGRPVQRNTTFEKCPITTPFTINCYYINFDKKWLGPVENTIIIPRYDGKRLITALTMTHSDNRWPDAASAFPIRFLEEPEIAIADLVKRGRRHRELTPFSHKRYCGPSSVEDPEYVSDACIPTPVGCI
jgi:hypothetical protein